MRSIDPGVRIGLALTMPMSGGRKPLEPATVRTRVRFHRQETVLKAFSMVFFSGWFLPWTNRRPHGGARLAGSEAAPSQAPSAPPQVRPSTWPISGAQGARGWPRYGQQPRFRPEAPRRWCGAPDRGVPPGRDHRILTPGLVSPMGRSPLVPLPLRARLSARIRPSVILFSRDSRDRDDDKGTLSCAVSHFPLPIRTARGRPSCPRAGLPCRSAAQRLRMPAARR